MMSRENYQLHLESFLKDHVTLKTRLMAVEISALPSQEQFLLINKVYV